MSNRAELTLDPRLVKLTPRSGVSIRRTLPHRKIRTIGAWCFVDHYGPTSQVDAMSVGAHPHTGLQTVSWLFSGEIEHRDSLGSVQKISSGELNLMTAGFGIAHSELSLDREQVLHGVQLWVALPEESRDCAPIFAHYADLPTFDYGVVRIKVLMGELLGHRSPAQIFSALVGAELRFAVSEVANIPVNPEFEHALLVDSGVVLINGARVLEGSLHYIPPGSDSIEIRADSHSRLMLLGGAPFKEEIVMWWNFIARSHDEIVEMRAAWESYSPRFAPFADRVDARIPAPAIPNIKLRARANEFDSHGETHP